MRGISKKCISLSLSLTIVAALAVGGAIAQDIVKMRKNEMDMLKDAMKAINGIVESGGATAGAAMPAQQIADIAKKIPDLFPKGSDQGDTSAKPEIWAHWDDFTAHAQKTEQAAQSVVAAANGGDAAALKTAFNALGGTCGSCHEDFKKKK